MRELILPVALLPRGACWNTALRSRGTAPRRALCFIERVELRLHEEVEALRSRQHELLLPETDMSTRASNIGRRASFRLAP